jgi:hypothetical protein
MRASLLIYTSKFPAIAVPCKLVCCESTMSPQSYRTACGAGADHRNAHMPYINRRPTAINNQPPFRPVRTTLCTMPMRFANRRGQIIFIGYALTGPRLLARILLSLGNAPMRYFPNSG